MDNWIQDLGVVGVLSVVLILVVKYLTQTLSWEIKNIHEILVKLIDKVGQLKETIDRMFNGRRK
mgnify:CR=1 FL=1